ncbi:zinc finger, CCHC-type containing protein [Tanacetum coccineum]
MVDSRPVMKQYNELLRILGQYIQHGLKMDESISVSSIIDKLPLSLKDFKHTLKHGKDDLSLVQLGSHLRIEESLRAQDSDKGLRVDAIAWWIDSGATTHVCKDRCWFKTYEPVEDGSVLYMGDDHFAPVHGKGSVVLEFSSGKSITLFNVLYVPKLRKNLISGPVLNKCGYKQVCKLVKSLYGLKQAPKQWHQKFDEVVLSSGFLLNQSDKCVYSKFDSSGKGVIICLYVDDMLIFGTDQNQVDKTKKFLSSKFSMKDMGEADVILGIKIKRENKGIVITQSHYIEKILKKFNRKDYSPVSTPMDPVEKLKLHTGKPVDQLEYSRAIGCLMYAMTSTRPDIAYAVGRLSRFTSNPSRQHWQAITRVFKYLKGTMNYGLSYMGYPSVLEGYSDASWINHVEDSSSTSGWVFLLGGGAISWASKKQTCITGSTIESEFVALAAASKEAEWLRNLIHEIPIWPKPIAPISIRCDSAPTMAKAYSQIYNGKSRHLGVRHSMIRELIMNGVISIEFVRSQKNLADHLTKGLARDLVNNSQLEIGTRVFIFPRCKTKRITYVNMKFCRFKKLGLGFLYVH